MCISNIKRTKTHTGNIKIGKDGQVDLGVLKVLRCPTNGKSSKSKMHLPTTKWTVKEYITGKPKEGKTCITENKKKARKERKGNTE